MSSLLQQILSNTKWMGGIWQHLFSLIPSSVSVTKMCCYLAHWILCGKGWYCKFQKIGNLSSNNLCTYTLKFDGTFHLALRYGKKNLQNFNLECGPKMATSHSFIILSLRKTFVLSAESHWMPHTPFVSTRLIRYLYADKVFHRYTSQYLWLESLQWQYLWLDSPQWQYLWLASSH